MQRSHTFVLENFRFHTGDVLPEVRIRCTTLGDARHDAVLALHGTNGSGEALLQPGFGGALFGQGQPLDAGRHFVVLPDAIGCGGSSKPSDGLRTRFPAYNYADMVHAQHRVLHENLGVRHLRLVIGHSMGGMHAWMWSQLHPDAMDIVVPMACSPTRMSGRNWMMRRLLTRAIRDDPEWKGGEYEHPPQGWRIASVMFDVATNGGTLALHHKAPTREQADRVVEQQLQAWNAGDANDQLYQWEASRDYDASGDLESVRARVLAIVAADDERNPVELGLLQQAIRRVPNGELMIIPAGVHTSGHATTAAARLYADELARLLRDAPRVAPAADAQERTA